MESRKVRCWKCGQTKPASDCVKQKKPSSKGFCRGCKSEMDREYRERNQGKLSGYFKELWRNNPERRKANSRYKDKARSGIFENGQTASEYVADKGCEHCGISNSEHKERYGTRLHIHHKDNQGRASLKAGLEPNNERSNLQILCNPCHQRTQNFINKGDPKERLRKSWETRRQKAQICN